MQPLFTKSLKNSKEILKLISFDPINVLNNFAKIEMKSS